MAMAQNGLAKLTEELGELGQVVGKLLAYPEGDHPDGGRPLRDRLEDETADVIAACMFVIESHKLDGSYVHERVEKKLARFRKWHAGNPDPNA
jgi:NTP pyrophosphatase (non-canonical NTP hydrolase)